MSVAKSMSRGHAKVLSRIMDRLRENASVDDIIRNVLRICCKATIGDVALLAVKTSGHDLETVATSETEFDLPVWHDSSDFALRPKLLADTYHFCGPSALPDQLHRFRSLLSSPMILPNCSPMAIIVLSRAPAAFSGSDMILLRRVCRVLGNWIDKSNHTFVQATNLVQIDDLCRSTGVEEVESINGVPAYARLAEWQGQIVAVTSSLLNVQREAVDSAVGDALARTGRLANSDRTYVFRIRDSDWLDNTHEWVAPGIEPMIDELQGLPVELMAEWRSRLDSGHAVEIPDIEALPTSSKVREVLLMQGIKSLLVVPMMRDGKLAGFVGYDAVRAHRSFDPLEIMLLKSVATAINVVMDRTAAEVAAEDARACLRAERDRLQAVLAAIPELVLEMDAEGRFVSYNSGAQLAPAIQPDHFIGRLPEDVLSDEHAGILRDLLKRVAERGSPTETEYEMDVDGHRRFFVATASPMSKQGTAGGVVLVVRDTTVRRRQERELSRLGKIAELTSNLVIVTNAADCIEWVNPAFERRTGWSLTEVRGCKPESFLQSQKTDRPILARITEALREGKQIQEELLTRSRSGEEYWVSMDVQPLIAANGQIEGFVSVQTDITSLKQSHEIALRDRAMAMDASIDGIAISDSAGFYTYMNKAHRQMFGLEPNEEIHCMTWRDFFSEDVAADFMSKEWPKFEAAGIWRGELPGLHRNGQTLQTEVSLTLREDGGVLCIARDISEHLKVSFEQARLREELQLAQRQESIAHIAAGVAHDLNNIVAVVAGTAGLLEAQCSDNEDVMTGLGRIKRATHIARDLVSGLGNLGRPEAKQAKHDLCNIISQAVGLLGTDRVARYGLSVTLPETSQLVWADSTELMQVVVNLTLNACEAGQPGTNKVQLQVFTLGTTLPVRSPDIGILNPRMRYSTFSVSDTGEGVDPAMRNRLFDRYFTTKGSSGTGLGLPIVAGILESNKALLWFDTVMGRGSTVTVAWPAYDNPSAELPHAQNNSIDDMDLSGLSILVVDDVADVAEILAEMLEVAGAVTIAMSDPIEAKLLLCENPGVWDVLVTDFHMPKVNGAELAKLANQMVPPVPSILVTALPEMATKAEAQFDIVLSKPTDGPTLIHAVKSAILARNQVTPRN